MHVVTFVLYVCVLERVAVCVCIYDIRRSRFRMFHCMCVCTTMFTFFSFVACSTKYGAGSRSVQVQKSGVRASKI